VSLDLFENQLYWLSRETGELIKQDKFGRGVPVTIAKDLVNPAGVKGIASWFTLHPEHTPIRHAPRQITSPSVAVYHRQRYNSSTANLCQTAGCSHLCLLVPEGVYCACPDHTHVQQGFSEKICDAGK